MKQSKGLQLFYNQPIEKQEKIRYVALKEFAEKGYDLASTNQIVDEAQISKGLLFKYFINKEELFVFLLEKKMEKKFHWMNGHNEQLPSDFFEILRWYTLREIEFFKEEPLFFKIIQHVSNQPEHPVCHRILQISKTYSDSIVKKLVQSLPSQSLREGIDVQRALQFIAWVFEGFKKQYIVNIEATSWEDDAMKEIDLLFTMIKQGIYHRE